MEKEIRELEAALQPLLPIRGGAIDPITAATLVKLSITLVTTLVRQISALSDDPVQASQRLVALMAELDAMEARLDNLTITY